MTPRNKVILGSYGVVEVPVERIAAFIATIITSCTAMEDFTLHIVAIPAKPSPRANSRMRHALRADMTQDVHPPVSSLGCREPKRKPTTDELGSQ